MNYLLIDTSGTHLTVVVLKGEEIFSEFLPDGNLKHSVTLMPAVENLLEKANTSITIKTPGNTDIVTFGAGELMDKKLYYCERGGTINTAGVTLGEWKVSEVTVI